MNFQNEVFGLARVYCSIMYSAEIYNLGHDLMFCNYLHETNIFKMMYSIVWQENQIGQLNTVIWSIIRLQP